jgi:DNA polymerase-3 subunit alpha (Gram-positive type)
MSLNGRLFFGTLCCTKQALKQGREIDRIKTMINELIESKEFLRLEKEYKFLSRARERLLQLEKEKYCIIDIETTGLEPINSEIIEIAVIKAENGEVSDVFNSLLSSTKPLTPQIKSLTGITDDMLSGAPAFKDVAAKVLNFISGSIVIAHNTDFDINFLNFHLKANNLSTIENRFFCTLKISRFLLTQLNSFKLGSLADHFGISHKLKHRALGDVEVTYQVWFKLIKLLNDRGIHSPEDLIRALG